VTARRCPTRLCTRPRAVAWPGGRAASYSATRCVALLACDGTRSGECLIRCTDWAEANLRSVGPVSHRAGPQHCVHGSRHLASNRRSLLPQCFGAHCATSFTAADSPHPYSFMSRSSLRSPGTAFGSLALSADAFGRSSLVACPRKVPVRDTRLLGLKTARLFQKPSECTPARMLDSLFCEVRTYTASARDSHVQRIRASPPQRRHSARRATVLAGGFGTEVLPLVRTSQSNPPFVSALRRRLQAIVSSRAGLRQAPVGRTTLPLHPTGRRCLGRR
jgi:hypothetical protein